MNDDITQGIIGISFILGIVLIITCGVVLNNHNYNQYQIDCLENGGEMVAVVYDTTYGNSDIVCSKK